MASFEKLCVITQEHQEDIWVTHQFQDSHKQGIETNQTISLAQLLCTWELTHLSFTSMLSMYKTMTAPVFLTDWVFKVTDWVLSILDSAVDENRNVIFLSKFKTYLRQDSYKACVFGL